MGLKFWPFHNHRLQLVDKTVSRPINLKNFRWEGEMSSAYERMIHGCTSFVWKCHDESCDHIVTVTVLGVPEKMLPKEDTE